MRSRLLPFWLPLPQSAHLGPPCPMSAPHATQAMAAVAQGASGLLLSATPIRAGGGRTLVLVRAGVRGVGGYWMSPPSNTGSLAGNKSPSSPLFNPNKTAATQLCVFIDKAKIKLLCFGWVGTSNQFCLAEKNFPYTLTVGSQLTGRA